MIPIGTFVAYITFETVSVPLYARIIWVLLTRSSFSKQPFYRFLIIFGISNLLNYFVVLLFYVLPMCSPTAFIYPQLPPGKWIAFAGFTVFYTAYQQDFLYLSISMNRLTAVWMPFKHQSHWKSWWLRHVLLAHLLPIPLTIQYLLCDGRFIQLEADDPGKGYLPLMMLTGTQIYDLDLNLTTIYVNGFCLATCLLFNIATFVRIYQIKKITSTTTGGGGISKMERNLSIIAVVMTAMLSSSLIFQLIIFLLRDGIFFPKFLTSVFNENDAFYRIYTQLPWINDLRVLSQPWLLLIVSEDIRRESLPWLDKYLHLFKKKESWKTEVQVLPLGKTLTQ